MRAYRGVPSGRLDRSHAAANGNPPLAGSGNLTGSRRRTKRQGVRAGRAQMQFTRL